MSNAKRVRWLEKGYRMLRDEVLPGAPARACVSVSVTTHRSAIGQCFSQYVARDGKHFIAVHPKLFSDGPDVLRVLLHEMVHASLPPNGKHGPEFRARAQAVGLKRPWTTTPAGDELAARLQDMAKRLGPVPKAAWVEPQPRKVPTTEVTCGCPRILHVPPDFLKSGNVKCMVCKKLFRERKVTR
ncbi:MAG: SprT-like domain-containing protein [Chloroflexota bacterium]